MTRDNLHTYSCECVHCSKCEPHPLMGRVEPRCGTYHPNAGGNMTIALVVLSFVGLVFFAAGGVCGLIVAGGAR